MTGREKSRRLNSQNTTPARSLKMIKPDTYIFEHAKTFAMTTSTQAPEVLFFDVNETLLNLEKLQSSVAHA